MYALHASNNSVELARTCLGHQQLHGVCRPLRYGYREEAIIMAKKTIDLFGGDLEKHGCLHEYYHPDTGEPIMTPFFQNWNFLVLNMIAFCEDRRALDCF
jgi:putative isomerase